MLTRVHERPMLVRGLSLVELMIGITVGMFVVAAASLLTTNQLNDNRRLMLETQVQQDLRAAADIVVRDLRRAGFWQEATTGVWTETGVNVAANPLSSIGWDAESPSRVTYTYGMAGAPTYGGVELVSSTLRLRTGATLWQPVTDAATLTITAFNVTLEQEQVDLGVYCVPQCVPSPAQQCPTQTVRWFNVSITGQARNDPSVVRSLRSIVRLPNDVVDSSTVPCP